MTALLATESPRVLPIEKHTDWADLGNNNMVLRSDMAYELGGSHLPALGCTAVTADENLVPEDQILLYGRDLPELTKDVPYARLAFARVGEESLGEGNALYNAIKKIEYTRFHCNPEGFMMRISTIYRRETVRISRDALHQGLDFTIAGNKMLQAFHQHSGIYGVKLIFIDLEQFDYDALAKCILRGEEITKTIDHMMKNVIMDCDACSLQQVCDEVEGLRELHFSS
jgi:hypothetical protein